MARVVELMANDDCAAAEPLLRRLLDEQQGDPAGLHHYLGVCRQAQGDFAGAEEQYRAALRVNPALFESLNNLGVVLGELGRHDESVAVLAMVTQAYPSEASAFYNLGFEQAQTGDLEAAAASFRKAADLDTCGTDALLQASVVLAALGRTDEQLAVLDEAAGRAPGDGIVAVTRARALRAAGRLDDAAAALGEAAASPANDARVLAALAFEYRDLGRNDEALAAARTAIERAAQDDEGFRIATLAFAVLAHRAGLRDEAEAALRAGAERLPNQPDIALFLGGLLVERRLCDEAVPLLKRALDAYAAADPQGAEAAEARRGLEACATSVP